MSQYLGTILQCKTKNIIFSLTDRYSTINDVGYLLQSVPVHVKLIFQFRVKTFQGISIFCSEYSHKSSISIIKYNAHFKPHICPPPTTKTNPFTALKIEKITKPFRGGSSWMSAGNNIMDRFRIRSAELADYSFNFSSINYSDI